MFYTDLKNILFNENPEPTNISYMLFFLKKNVYYWYIIFQREQ